MVQSVYTSDVKDDTDLSMHSGHAAPSAGSGVSSDAYAWTFVVVAVGLLWAIGRGFRSVNSG